jgi:hypothetical protein
MVLPESESPAIAYQVTQILMDSNTDTLGVIRLQHDQTAGRSSDTLTTRLLGCGPQTATESGLVLSGIKHRWLCGTVRGRPRRPARLS